MDADTQSRSRPTRRLHTRVVDCKGLTVYEQGVTLGPDFPLVRKTAQSYQPANADDIRLPLEAVFEGRGSPTALAGRLAGIANALDSGEFARARILGLYFPINALTERQLARLKSASSMVKAGFDPGEARDERGRWTGADVTPAVLVAPFPGHPPKLEPGIPPIPPFPPGESIYRNIEFARTHSLLALKARWQDWGEWDYKRRFGFKYHDAGNFNFGVTAAAYGWPDELILRSGAVYHWFREKPNRDNRSNPLGEYPYGDTLKNESQILAGIRWYRNGGYDAGTE